MRVDAHGWLDCVAGDPQVIRYTSIRTCTLDEPQPRGIVWHWTAGVCHPGFASALAKSIIGYDAKKDRAASWHVLIGKNGTIHQSVPFLLGAWHVGRAGNIGGTDYLNINHATVGCELENAGRLLKLGPKVYVWPYWLNPDDPTEKKQPDPKLEIDPARGTLVLGDGLFDTFTPEQETSATALLGALVAAYSWGPSVCTYGHVQFDQRRKEDPGYLWLHGILPRILDKVFPERVCR